MAVLITDIYDSQAVAARRTQDPSNAMGFVGKAFFPNRKKLGLSLKWIKTHKGLNAILKPSNFDAIPMIRAREGFKQESTEMIFFRESMTVREEDLMRLMEIEDANSPFIGDIISSIYNDVARLIDGAEIAAEVMRMALLAPKDGKPSIAIGTGEQESDNMVYGYDYDGDGTYKQKHYLEIQGTDTWDHPDTAKPLKDVQQGTKYLKSIGVLPRYAMMNSTTFDYLVENEQIKNALITSSGKTVDFTDEATVKEIFTRKTGLTPIIYDKMYIDYKGETQKFYPDDKVTIIGAGTLGSTYYGVTPEERTLMSNKNVDVAMLDNRIAIATKTEQGPPIKTTTSVSQIVLPSYEGIDSTFVIDVK